MSRRGRRGQGSGRAHSPRAALTLGALGVVFGDIGTSPLYAVQTVFTADHHAVGTTRPEVDGIISLVFWSITIIVSVKYLTFILRADNHGEGGIMALTALLQNQRFRSFSAKVLLVTLGIVGASLFYGDGIITPAISVLSTVEGLKVSAPGLHDYVLPIALVVLTVLFVVQHFGTSLIGRLFGPVMVIWFAVLAPPARWRWPGSRGSCGRCPRPTEWCSSPTTGRSRSSPSRRSSSRSPARRPSTPTSIGGADRAGPERSEPRQMGRLRQPDGGRRGQHH